MITEKEIESFIEVLKKRDPVFVQFVMKGPKYEQVMFNTLKRWREEHAEMPTLDGFTAGLKKDIALVDREVPRKRHCIRNTNKISIATKMMSDTHQIITKSKKTWDSGDFCTFYAQYLVCMRDLAETPIDYAYPASQYAQLLHFAAIDGLTDFGRLLIEHGADINAVDGSRQSALIHAVANERRDFAELLLTQPTIDVCLRSNLDATPEKLTKRYTGIWRKTEPLFELLRQASIRQFFREARGAGAKEIATLLEQHKDSNISLKDICQQMYLLFKSNDDPETRKIMITEMIALIMDLPIGKEDEKERIVEQLRDWERVLKHLLVSPDLDLGQPKHTSKPLMLIANMEDYLKEQKHKQNASVLADRDLRYKEINATL